jgi:uncharacterized membrane protein
MSDIFAAAATAAIALSAATVKTVVQVTAPANHRVKILGWGVFFDGASATAVPVRVRLLKQTSSGTMTPLTLRQTSARVETTQSIATHTATAEPTAGDIVDIILVHPQQGYEIKYTPGQEIVLGGGERIGIDCNAPATVNVTAKILFEE